MDAEGGDGKEEGVGPRWGCVAIDRETRFVVAWTFASSEEEAAKEVVRKVRERTEGRRGIQWISDGRAVYRREVKRVYRDPERTGRRGRPRLKPTPGTGLVQAVKRRHKGRVIGVEVRVIMGQRVKCPYPVHQERMNGVLRDRLACLTRKTHAFAKCTETWDAMVILCLFEHNWLRGHPALKEEVRGLANGWKYLRKSPAQACGLTDHIWSWEEFLTHSVYQYHMG